MSSLFLFLLYHAFPFYSTYLPSVTGEVSLYTDPYFRNLLPLFYKQC
jgi:hypothetical protein